MHSYNLQQNLNLCVRGLGSSPTVAINERCNELIKRDPDTTVYKLGLGQSPFPVPGVVQRALKENVHQKDYLPVRGLYELREAIASFHNGQLGEDRFTASDVLIGPGSKELMFLLQFAFCGELLIPSPSWVSYEPQARIIGRPLRFLPTDEDYQLRPETLKEVIDQDPSKPRLLILNYPSNPVGLTFSDECLSQMADVLRGSNVLVLSDEIYMLTHHDREFRSIAKYLPEQTIVSSGVSKGFGMGGYRLGHFLFPSKLRWLLDAMAALASETFTSVSAPIQHACIKAFIQDSDEDRQEMEDYLRRSAMILKWLGASCHSRLIAAGATGPAPDGAFYLFLDFSKTKMCERRKFSSSLKMCEALLEETGVAILPGGSFGRPQEELTVRIAFVDFDGAHALNGLAALECEGQKIDVDQFLWDHCGKTMKAFERMAEWLDDVVSCKAK